MIEELRTSPGHHNWKVKVGGVDNVLLLGKSTQGKEMIRGFREY